MPDFEKYFSVIDEDNHLIFVNKRSGVLVQGDETGDTPLSEMVKEYIRIKYNKPGNVFTGVIHRLDRPVTGLVVLAKTSKGLERMNELFRDKTIQKTYWAIVQKRPAKEEGTLIHWMVKDTSRNISKAFAKEVKGSLKAELSYKLISSLENLHLLEVKPVTGRPHQIRVQLATMGCPIYGDLKYGSNEKTSDGSIMLHARKLNFIHPIKKEPIEIKAGLPQNSVWRNFSYIDTK